MWLRRMVAIFMIITCVGLNGLALLGIVLPDKTKAIAAKAQQATVLAAATLPPPAPTLTLSSSPTTISAGSSAGLSWSTTGNPTTCTASGSWSGDKTPFGSESTGRISSSGNYTYSMTCSNVSGKAEASAIVTVGNAPPPARSSTTSTTQSAAAAATYCGGRQPCYGPHDLSSHTGGGNCWGWNGDRVIDLSGFDAAFHITKSGISSIQTGQLCGHDLAASLNGQASAGGQTRVHTQATKSNSDSNEIPYFVGYYDASKP